MTKMREIYDDAKNVVEITRSKCDGFDEMEWKQKVASALDVFVEKTPPTKSMRGRWIETVYAIIDSITTLNVDDKFDLGGLTIQIPIIFSENKALQAEVVIDYLLRYLKMSESEITEFVRRCNEYLRRNDERSGD